MPTSVPRVFLSHPVTMDAADTEGAAGLGTVDTSVTLPIVVLGPKIPVAGDRAVVHAVGGRWVSGQGGGTPVECSTFYCAACNEYLKITGGVVTDANGTHALDSSGNTPRINFTTDQGFNGSDCTPSTLTTQYFYTFSCSAAGISLVLTSWAIDCTGLGTPLLYDNPDTDATGFGTTATPSNCNPVTSSHTFSPQFGLDPPVASATVSIPMTAGQTCAPCCIPGPQYGTLTATLANSFGTTGCTETSLALSPTVSSGITAWGANFCDPPRTGSPLALGFACDPLSGLLRCTVTNPFDVNPLVCSYTLVDCSFLDNVFHAHFHVDDCTLRTYNDIYIDS